MNETTLIPDSQDESTPQVEDTQETQDLASETTEVEQELKEESQKPKTKVKKISKLDFIVNLFQGKPGREGDETPHAPITEVDDLAEKVKVAEEAGYFRVRTDTKVERNEAKYKSEVKWYLTQAAKKELIEREYNPRKKAEATESA